MLLNTACALTLAASPWLEDGAFSHLPCSSLAEAIGSVPVSSIDMLKAFSATNHADAAFGAVDGAAVQWCCANEACAAICACEKPTLQDALVRAGAPCAARLATTSKGRVVPPVLTHFLQGLTATTGRAYRDVDAYVTIPHASSASIGWHCDDVDVLLILLDGSKRFRVAGPTVGSTPVIDHQMRPGDAIYIPAGVFHSGGDSRVAAEASTLLSVAMVPDDEAKAQEAVAAWRRARDGIRRRLPSPRCNDWDWAGSADGIELMRKTLGRSAAAMRFCPAPE